MKRIHGRGAALLAACALLFGLSGCAEKTKVEEIQERGYLLVGTTGDYRPMSYLEPETGEYWGFDIEFSQIIAERLGVEVQFVETSWPTLSEDTLNEDLYDMALSGISITDQRKETMLMSDGYLCNGKTILCRAQDANLYPTLDSIDRPEVTVMVNPGGLNEKFAREHLQNAQLLVHEQNEEIPGLIAEGEADIMITEILEAPYYVENDPRLAAPLLEQPFTNGQVGVLMRQEDTALCEQVNEIIAACKQDGTLDALYEKYDFVNG